MWLFIVYYSNTDDWDENRRPVNVYTREEFLEHVNPILEALKIVRESKTPHLQVVGTLYYEIFDTATQAYIACNMTEPYVVSD